MSSKSGLPSRHPVALRLFCLCRQKGAVRIRMKAYSGEARWGTSRLQDTIGAIVQRDGWTWRQAWCNLAHSHEYRTDLSTLSILSSVLARLPSPAPR